MAPLAAIGLRSSHRDGYGAAVASATYDLDPVEPPASLSPSSISSFKDCPLAFRFSYLDRLPQPPTVATSKGTLVHRALERLYDRPPAERTREAALVDLDRATDDLRDDPDFTGLDLSEAEWENFAADARALTLRTFDLEDPAQVTPVGLELKLQVSLGDVTVRGVIDRLERTPDGDLVISDYKTGRVPGDRYVDKSLAGVQLYALMCQRLFGAPPARVQLLYLKAPTAIVATPSAQQLEGVARRTNAIWSTIATACERNEFRTNTGRLCDFCAYKPVCPAHDGDPRRAVELFRAEPVSGQGNAS